MNSNEITLKQLREDKSVLLENGKVVEFIRDVAKNEWRQSASDNKSRAIVSVDGIESSYPLYIDEIRKFAETGILPKHKANYLTGEKIARTISTNEAAHRNVSPLKTIKRDANESLVQSELKRYEDLLQAAQTLSKKYGFRTDADHAFNLFTGYIFHKEYENKMRHVQEVCRRYKSIVTMKQETLKNELAKAKVMLSEYTANNAEHLTNKEVLHHVQELAKNVQSLEDRLEEEENKVYLTDQEICRRYNIE